MKCNRQASISFSLETALKYLGDPLYNVQGEVLEAEVRQGFPQSACARKGKHTAKVICHKSNVIFTSCIVNLAVSIRHQYF